MGSAYISLTYPPNIDPTRATLAFGNWAPGRFKRELEDDCVRVRQLSLYALSQYLHDPQNVAAVINAGVMESLIGVMHDSDETCRKVAAESLRVMNSHAIGRDACVKHGLLKPLEDLLTDEDKECRIATSEAINALCDSVDGCLEIVETKTMLPVLSKVVDKDVDSVVMFGLLSMSKILMSDIKRAHSQVLDDNFLNTLCRHLNHFLRSVQLAALECLAALSFAREAKVVINKSYKRLIPIIIEHLESDEPRCRAKAALCLANVIMFAKGKKWACGFSALSRLMPMTCDVNSDVRVNALSAITRIAELPSGRVEALQYLDRVQRLLKDPVANVRKHAAICIKVITWKP